MLLVPEEDRVMPQKVKKSWTEPELIVIVRGKPEEAVRWAVRMTRGQEPARPVLSGVGRAFLGVHHVQTRRGRSSRNPLIP